MHGDGIYTFANGKVKKGKWVEGQRTKWKKEGCKTQ